MGFHIMIPSLRKILSNNVEKSLFGALFAVPALIEGSGFPLGGIIYNSAFESDPLNAQWVFYGISSAFVAGLLAFIALSYWIQKKYFSDVTFEKESFENPHFYRKHGATLELSKNNDENIDPDHTIG